MEIITVLLPIAIFLGLFFIAGFVYMTMIGQYDDLETPALRMLLDQETIKTKNNDNEMPINNDSNKDLK